MVEFRHDDASKADRQTPRRSWLAPALALSLAMDDPARPEINGLPVVESTANGRRTFTAALGTASKIVLAPTGMIMNS